MFTNNSKIIAMKHLSTTKWWMHCSTYVRSVGIISYHQNNSRYESYASVKESINWYCRALQQTDHACRRFTSPL